MDKIFQLVMVLALIFIIIMGLNISNQGINELTMADRAPVVGLDFDDGSIDLKFLGENYGFSRDEFINESYLFWEKGLLLIEKGIGYLTRAMDTLHPFIHLPAALNS